MCGICGIWDQESPQNLRERVQAMTRLVAHRGPDDEGFALLGRDSFVAWGGTGASQSSGPEDGLRIAFGHRRLSIIDLSSAGHQPFASEDWRWWIVFNGEIYNHIELREELASQGSVFRTRTDTEVVLAAWRTWGAQCLERFNGMWAFAVYDCLRNVLFLSRDRFGVKPLYYKIRPAFFCFSSELKQLQSLPGEPARVNSALLADLFFWKFEAHTSETFFEDVRVLPAGHYMTLTADALASGTLECRRFWTPRPAPRQSEHQAVDTFRNLLENAVRLRLRSDVPVGLTLSGGLDSSSITCLAAALLQEDGADPMQVFTAVFDDPGFSEENFATAVARRTGSRHIVVRPEAGDLRSDWGDFIWTMESPFSGLSYYANWKVYQRIREAGVKVVLNGQGGDELLLGYDRYRAAFLKVLLSQGYVYKAVREFFKTRANTSLMTQKFAYVLYFTFPALRAARCRRRVLPYLNKDFFAFGKARLDHVKREMGYRDRVELQISQFDSYQLPHLLLHEDNVSMSHSVEARLPFLDYRLFEFILGQADDLLIRDGWSKVILRSALQSCLPEEIKTRRTKMGYDTPTLRLLRQNMPFFRDLLQRHERDHFLDTPALLRDYNVGKADEHVLSTACTYLSWKEAFHLET